MSRFLIAAVTAAALVVVSAPADAANRFKPDCSERLIKSANKHRAIVIDRHGKRAPGRDIVKWGRIGPNQQPHTVGCKTLKRYRNQLIQLHAVPRYTTLSRTAVDPHRPPAGVQTPGVEAPAGGTLDQIAQCESGGDPTAVSPDGTYRGKYQFDQQTWESVGGTGDPAAAPEAVQDEMAARLHAQRGSQPWPVCG